MQEVWSYLISIIGVILAVFFYLKSRRNKKSKFRIKSFNVLKDFSSSLSSLEFVYAGKKIKNLTITKIGFWNDGTDTIYGNDIAEADPIRIVVDEKYEILDVGVIHASSEANQFSTARPEDRKNNVIIRFDYLDKQEGGIIQLINTAKSSNDIKVLGTIKGSGKPISAKILFPSLPTKIRRVIMVFGFLLTALTLFLGFVAFLLGIYAALFQKSESFILLFAALMYGILGVSYYLVFMRREIPAGFEVIEEEHF